MGLSDHPVAKVPLKELHSFNRAQTFIRPIVVPCGPGSLLVSFGAFEPKEELVGLTVVGHGLSCRLAFKVRGGEDLFQVPMAREGVFSTRIRKKKASVKPAHNTASFAQVSGQS